MIPFTAARTASRSLELPLSSSGASWVRATSVVSLANLVTARTPLKTTGANTLVSFCAGVPRIPGEEEKQSEGSVPQSNLSALNRRGPQCSGRFDNLLCLSWFRSV